MDSTFLQKYKYIKGWNILYVYNNTFTTGTIYEKIQNQKQNTKKAHTTLCLTIHWIYT